MKSGRVSRSAQEAAFVRAVETIRPKRNRLFEDHLAQGLLKPVRQGITRLLRCPGIGMLVLALRERRVPGFMGSLICRTRFIDDSLRRALAEDFEQVVILGAGFDTRSYRIPGIERLRVFEVDRPATQTWKQDRLKRMLGEIPSYVTLVPTDLDCAQLEGALAEAGFCLGARAFFIWEGSTQFHTPEAVDAILRYVACTAAAGSRIAFTYVHRGVITGTAHFEGMRRLVSLARRLGEPWIFGFDPTALRGYLAARGLALVEDVGAKEYTSRYLHPLGRQLRVFEGERTALAQIARSWSELVAVRQMKGAMA